MVLINAQGLIVGRLSSIVAKKLLEGEEVTIINADKAILSGSKASTFAEFKQTVDRGTTEKGPYYPKRPDAIIKRTIRGMLPYKAQRGKDAMARLRVFIGTPTEVSGKEAVTLEKASVDRLSSYKYMELGELSKLLGSKF
ncbi:50S ribosomal protein L13P [Methanocella paludicola SANAE]|uniref:Large ribosomal subunit protein uL13 n=1 Tax=Methanocella paludicola (strain DSM 17711 / JCM 13418 / NBRC 101707 / SANAE) TaxID=304371 RepID=D1YZ46_METPS|nr:50S ribosomal protein L13 [Methanocella paludicola]BAI61718.1 50S ribosomal protein L13P [Methanocella paludicola SANAE]